MIEVIYYDKTGIYDFSLNSSSPFSGSVHKFNYSLNNQRKKILFTNKKDAEIFVKKLELINNNIKQQQINAYSLIDEFYRHTKLYFNRVGSDIGYCYIQLLS